MSPAARRGATSKRVRVLHLVDDMDELAQRLRSLGSACVILDLGVPLPTAQAAADALKVPVRLIFKSLVVRGGGPMMEDVAVVVLAGDARLDRAAVAAALGWGKATLAEPAVALARTGYPTGGTPPVGHREALPVLVDEDLLALGEGYAGGGRSELLLRIDAREILRLTGGRVARVAKRG